MMDQNASRTVVRRIMIKTDRLSLCSASREQMAAMIVSEQDEELKKAYAEMLRVLPAASRSMELVCHMDDKEERWDPDRDLCQGLDADGTAEIGHGLLEEYQASYGTEAVKGRLATAEVPNDRKDLVDALRRHPLLDQ